VPVTDRQIDTDHEPGRVLNERAVLVIVLVDPLVF
jgi:hypothetical protein